MPSKVTRTERGWAGHFICASDCRFRRNTLLELNDIRIVISTVGAYFNRYNNKYDEIGFNRIYETMAFHAEFKDPYWDADVHEQVYFDSEWQIKGEEIAFEDDLKANNMHEIVVKEITRKLKKGEITNAFMDS